MSAGLGWATAALVCALLPALMLARNLPQYRARALLGRDAGDWPARAPASAVSVLIPARDEQDAIAAAVRSVLDSRGVTLELIVLNDGSRDATRARAEAAGAGDARLRVVDAPPLPPGWCGKQYACETLSRLARYPALLFLDADVRLEPLGLARSVALLEHTGVALLSGFPRQITVTWLERWLIPLIHFVLLGFLPLARMRRRPDPRYGAGCGQFMLTRRDAYRRAGGHAAIRDSLHDGVKLPRAFRRAGLPTELFDATPVARCRMYRGAAEVWAGLGKNATEGLAAPGLIGPVTALLGVGQVLPPLLLLLGVSGALSAPATALAGLATAAVYLPRLVMARRFRQPFDSVLAHPLAVLLLLAIQWQALGRRLRRRPSVWKDRAYVSTAR